MRIYKNFCRAPKVLKQSHPPAPGGVQKHAVEIFFELNHRFRSASASYGRQLAKLVVRFGRAEFFVYLRFDFLQAFFVQPVFLVVLVRLVSVGRDQMASCGAISGIKSVLFGVFIIAICFGSPPFYQPIAEPGVMLLIPRARNFFRCVARAVTTST